MRTALLAMTAVALLAGCRQSADNPAANAAALRSGQVLPQMDAAVAIRAPATKEAAVKLMQERNDNMKKIGKAFKELGRELKASTPDLGAVRSSAATIAGLAPRVPSWFPAGTGPDVGKTRAKAEIWQKPMDFAAKTKAFQSAVRTFDAAAKSKDLAAIQLRFADLGKTCKSCHDSYRSEEKK